MGHIISQLIGEGSGFKVFRPRVLGGLEGRYGGMLAIEVDGPHHFPANR